MAERIKVTEREPDPGQQWKCGDEFLPFHPQASHVPAEYRDGWNRCYWMAVGRAARPVTAAEDRALRKMAIQSSTLVAPGRLVSASESAVRQQEARFNGKDASSPLLQGEDSKEGGKR